MPAPLTVPPHSGPIDPDELARRVNDGDHRDQPYNVSGEQLQRWLVEAGYAELDQFGWLVPTERARRLASEAFA